MVEGKKTITIHELKTWPEFFHGVTIGTKPFEVREDDRGFKVDDVLVLREWDPRESRYTGARCVRGVSFVLRGPGFGVEAGFVVMGLWLLPQQTERAVLAQVEVQHA